MLFFVGAAVGVTARAPLGRESERRLRFATDRFQPHTREIDIVLRGVNGAWKYVRRDGQVSYRHCWNVR
jgi:hypothetical protein